MSEDSAYMCTLDGSTAKKAKIELNEEPQDRMAAVQAFREWIQAQPHITFPKTDAKTLLRFLRASKFSQVRARSMLEGYLGLRNKAPDLFLDIDSHDPKIRSTLETGFLCLLPKRTPEGCQIMLISMHRIAKVNFKAIDVMRTITMLMDNMSLSEATQVNGIALVIDMSNASPQLLAKFMTGDAQRWQKMWAKNIPGRQKGFHHYRAGLVIEIITTFAKSFMPKKWTDRFTFHDTMESLYHTIPMECLPDEYLPDDYTGERNGTLDELVKQNIADVSRMEIRNEILYKTSTAFKLDETKRPAQQITQHFRKLNVD